MVESIPSINQTPDPPMRLLLIALRRAPLTLLWVSGLSRHSLGRSAGAHIALTSQEHPICYYVSFRRPWVSGQYNYHVCVFF